MARRITRAARRRDALATMRLRDTYEARLRPRLQAEFTRTARDAGNALPAWQHVLAAHRSRLLAILRPILRTASLAAAHHRRSVFHKFSELALEEKDGPLPRPTLDQIEADILAEVDARALALVDDISATTRRRILNCIERGVSANEGPAATAARILDEVGGMSHARAMTIARTEVGQAMATAEQTEMEATETALGVTIYKVWNASPDDRTRPSHADADGQEARMDAMFTVGESEMLHPLDPNGPPEEVINCRCCLTYDHRAAED